MEMLVHPAEGDPAVAHAHRADDIVTAVRIAEEFDLDIVIEHCTEGHQSRIFWQLETFLPL